ncbi:condensation domain-containing protein [Micromonospora sp. DT31]|uniref:condensation domain-containing protein n=1 Tax=Micromonospora sp. DT31 TaxID=3393434 RepID=UPI003CE9D3A6
MSTATGRPDRQRRLYRPHPAMTGRPLAPQQRGLWFLQQLRPASAEYNVQIALRLRGPLRLDCLENALNILVMRHEPLRTTIRADASGQPRQFVWPTRQVRLEPEHVRAHDGRDGLARDIVQQEVGRPFDLAGEWPMRVRLVRLGEDDHLLAVTFNHLAVDGVSLSVLSDELSTVYEALVTGRPVRLPDLGLTFADYAAWQSARGMDEAGLAYWRQELDGVGDLDLPADRTGHGVGATMITIRREVAEQTVRDLTRLTRSAGNSLFAACLAGYALLLHGSTGQRDFAIGMPVAARTDAACERLVGCFMNTVCVRFRISPELTVRELVGRTARALAGGLEHQAVPFGEVVRAVRPARATSRHPLFSAFCSAVDGAPPSFALAELDTEVVVADYPVARFDLNATFALGLRRAAVQMEFSDALFEPATAQRLADRLIRVLDWVAADGERRIGAVPVLGRVERHHVLSLLNGRGDG